MKRILTQTLKALLVTLILLSLTGCIIEALGAVGTGAFYTAEYLATGSVTKTISHEFGRIKKALLVALCRMEISVDMAREIDDGEEIIAKADQLEIRVQLKQVTSSVTRISVKAGKGFMNRDKATAQEILSQTNKIAEKLVTKSWLAQKNSS